MSVPGRIARGEKTGSRFTEDICSKRPLEQHAYEEKSLTLSKHINIICTSVRRKMILHKLGNTRVYTNGNLGEMN